MDIDWDMYFDEDDYTSSGGANNTYDEFAEFDDYDYDYGDLSRNDSDYISPYESPYQQASGYEDASLGDYYNTGGLIGAGSSLLNKYSGKGTLAGGLLGGADGRLSGQDLGTYLGAGIGAYRQDKANDRYNEMMQPMTDLYKSQAADVAQRRANRGTNIASEFDIAMGMMQPSWDRADQKDANLAQHQGVTQSSANAWNKAASEQRRDLTKLYTQQQIEKSYDDRTGVLGGQLSNPWTKEYGQRQQNPYLNMGIQGLMGEIN